MEDLLKYILQTTITVCVPILIGYLVSFLRTKKNAIYEKIGNENVKAILDNASEIVLKSVIEVSQTYVDTLKKEQTFSKENQLEAFELAKEKANKLISGESARVIESIYGNYSDWLENAIEVAVNKNK